MLAVLDPDLVRTADHFAAPADADRELHGATRIVEEALAYTALARFAGPIRIHGAMGIVVAPRGQLRLVIACTVNRGKITAMDVIADPARLRSLDLAAPDL